MSRRLTDMEQSCIIEDETKLVRESGINFYYQLGIISYEEAIELLEETKEQIRKEDLHAVKES